MLRKDTERSFQISVVWNTLQAGKCSGPLEAAESLPQVDASDFSGILSGSSDKICHSKTIQVSQIPQSLQPICLSGWVKEVNTWTGLGNLLLLAV